MYNVITIVGIFRRVGIKILSGLDECGNTIMISVVLLFLWCVLEYKCVVAVKSITKNNNNLLKQ